MSCPTPALSRRLAGSLLVASALVGCGSLDVKKQAEEQTKAVRTGPEARPHRSITSFSPALRCMDQLLVEHDVRDVSVLLDGLADETKKVNAGTRDMMISALSEMTRRSRAVRLVVFGADTPNIAIFLQNAQRQNPFAVLPQYGIRGSISQLDESLIRAQKQGGIGIPGFNTGISKDVVSSVLSLDLSVMRTEDLSVVSSATSKNSVVILKQGSGIDGDVAYQKFGISYSMTLDRAEGRAQALRGLVELAVIELIGKLTRTPYWSCLGVDSGANEEVRAEISDWYFALKSDRQELIAFFQGQMRARGYYDGPVDGQFNADLDAALTEYRTGLGLSSEPVIDESLFTAYLQTRAGKLPRPVRMPRPLAAPAPQLPAAPAAVPAASAAATAPAAAPVARIGLATQKGKTRFARGEPFGLVVKPTRAAHVYCYLQDEAANLMRFYPNRFARDAFVPAGRSLEIPGKMRFQFVMSQPGAREAVSCFAANTDVLAALPRHLVGTDFEALPGVTFEQIRQAFAEATSGAFTQETLNVQTQ